MRILILALLAGCYDPPIDDCQFRCGDNNACPVGTTCDTQGFCRSTATGTCTAAADAAVDVPPGFCASPPSGCDPGFEIPGGCATYCRNSQKFSDARNQCNTNGWRIAILDSIPKLDALHSTTGNFWVGAQRNNTLWFWETTTLVSNDSWATGIPPTSGDSCALVDGAGKRLNNNTSCESDAPFACTR